MNCLEKLTRCWQGVSWREYVMDLPTNLKPTNLASQMFGMLGPSFLTNYLLTESEVLTANSQTETLRYWLSQWGQYCKVEVWDFPVKTERWLLIRCLLHGFLLCFCKPVIQLAPGHYGRRMPYNELIRACVISATRTSHIITLNNDGIFTPLVYLAKGVNPGVSELV